MAAFAYVLGIVSAAVIVIGYRVIHFYCRKRSKGSDNNASHIFADNTLNEKRVTSKSEASTTKQERPGDRLKETSHDRYVRQKTGSNGHQPVGDVYENTAAIETAENDYTSLSPETMQKHI